MSLYEASAHIFYGVRIQRIGRDADPDPPIKDGDLGYISAEALLRSRGQWQEVPDWYAAFEKARKADPKISYLKDLPSDHEVLGLYRAHLAAIDAQTFGCDLITMGGSDAEDLVMYAVIEESHKSCSSEDDHGGFGERVLDHEILVKGPDWDERLAKFCAKIGIPTKLVTPRWTLSMRG